MQDAGLLIGGEWVAPAASASVRDKFSGAEIGRYGVADEAQVDSAVEAARAAFRRGTIHPYRRFEIIAAAGEILRRRRDEIVEAMLAETGFTRKDALNDFGRALQTMAISAEEAKRIVGEMIPVQGAPGQHEEKLAFT